MTPSRSTVTSTVAERKGERTWNLAASPGLYTFFSGTRSMRSLSPASNHHSPLPATQTSRLDDEVLPPSSVAVACRMTLPETGDLALHSRRPLSSVVPSQMGPTDLVSVTCS